MRRPRGVWLDCWRASKPGRDRLTEVRRFLFSLLLLLPYSSFASDQEYNGRWDITVFDEGKRRAWWLEIEGAGTPQISGKFVGAPGGQLDTIPQIGIDNKGELKFVFKRKYKNADGVFRATVWKGKLDGTFQIDGDPNKVHWVGARAPKIHEDGKKLHEGDSVELVNHADLVGWRPLDPANKAVWGFKTGNLVNSPGASDLVSDKKFWDFRLRAEFRIGAKSNSGIGLRGRYEVQILDDHGQAPTVHSNGALYGRIAPVINASKEPGQWQTFDITLIGDQLTVILNEAKIIDRKTIDGLTAIAIDANEDQPGPIVLQGDHGPVEFRRLTVIPLVKGKQKNR
jgi:hypothetical protein